MGSLIILFWVTLPTHTVQMKGYCNNNSILQEQYFGLHLYRACMVIVCAFGWLKARFPSLRQPMDIHLCHLPHVIYVCFVLHNYCEAGKETLDELSVLGAMHQECQPPTQRNKYVTDWNEGGGKRVRRVVSQVP